MTTDERTDRRDDESGWVRQGLRGRTWLHALAAFASGALGVIGLPSIFVGVLFSGLFGLVIFGLVGGGIGFAFFAWLGVAFTGDRRAIWLGCTVFAWLGAAIAGFLGSTAGELGDIYSSPELLRACLYGGTAAASCALLAHRGPARILGAVGLAGLVVVVSSIAAPKTESPQFPATPTTTEVSGYLAVESPVARDLGGPAYWAPYAPEHGGEIAFAIIAQAAPESAPCIEHQIRDAADPGTTDTQIECVQDGDYWVRSGKRLHEVSLVGADSIVRAVGQLSTPLDVLREAVANATPAPR